MEGIIGKESESILRFFILLENIQVKMDQLMAPLCPTGWKGAV